MTISSLQAVQNTLDSRGVADIKFLFNRGANGDLISTVLSDVTDVLVKHLAETSKLQADFSREVLPLTV